LGGTKWSNGTAPINATLGADPDQTLADAGSRSAAVFEALAGHADAVVAIGREGKSHRAINAATLSLSPSLSLAVKM
jgi:hypothetical protein